jgi:hypothetical protein
VKTHLLTGHEFVILQSEIVGMLGSVGVDGTQVPMSTHVHDPVAWQGHVPVKAQSGTQVPSSKQVGLQVPSSWQVLVVGMVGVESEGVEGDVSGQLPKSSQVQSPLSKHVQFPK